MIGSHSAGEHGAGYTIPVREIMIPKHFVEPYIILATIMIKFGNSEAWLAAINVRCNPP